MSKSCLSLFEPVLKCSQNYVVGHITVFSEAAAAVERSASASKALTILGRASVARSSAARAFAAPASPLSTSRGVAEPDSASSADWLCWSTSGLGGFAFLSKSLAHGPGRYCGQLKTHTAIEMRPIKMTAATAPMTPTMSSDHCRPGLCFQRRRRRGLERGRRCE